MRPHSIELFEKTYLASIALSIASTVFTWSEVTASMRAASSSGVALGSSGMIASVAISNLVSLLLWYFVARRASNIAKWIYVVITAIGLLMVLNLLVGSTNGIRLAMVSGLIVTALQVFAAWLLFKPDAAAWLESEGANGPGDPSTFE